MKTQDAITIVSPARCSLALQMNNGNMKDAVKDSCEVALKVLRQRQRFHTRGLEESDNRSAEIDAQGFYAGVFQLRGEFHAGGES
jgi:hypothetical protein